MTAIKKLLTLTLKNTDIVLVSLNLIELYLKEERAYREEIGHETSFSQKRVNSRCGTDSTADAEMRKASEISPRLEFRVAITNDAASTSRDEQILTSNFHLD